MQYQSEEFVRFRQAVSRTANSCMMERLQQSLTPEGMKLLMELRESTSDMNESSSDMSISEEEDDMPTGQSSAIGASPWIITSTFKQTNEVAIMRVVQKMFTPDKNDNLDQSQCSSQNNHSKRAHLASADSADITDVNNMNLDSTSIKSESQQTALTLLRTRLESIHTSRQPEFNPLNPILENVATLESTLWKSFEKCVSTLTATADEGNSVFGFVQKTGHQQQVSAGSTSTQTEQRKWVAVLVDLITGIIGIKFRMVAGKYVTEAEKAFNACREFASHFCQKMFGEVASQMDIQAGKESLLSWQILIQNLQGCDAAFEQVHQRFGILTRKPSDIALMIISPQLYTTLPSIIPYTPITQPISPDPSTVSSNSNSSINTNNNSINSGDDSCNNNINSGDNNNNLTRTALRKARKNGGKKQTSHKRTKTITNPLLNPPQPPPPQLPNITVAGAPPAN
ncbi:hypothetical protein HDU76_008778 [Blyttiomyces sp. JEL0837]|nr:hypothetical protein HDU76_008778 [Blyttiomyces sp. JEL0837]